MLPIAESIFAIFIWLFIFFIFKKVFLLKKPNEFFVFELAILVLLFMLYGWVKLATI